MKKAFTFIKSNILFLATLFLLAFIPLYPKLPIVDVTNTWVYVRAEDFIIAAVLTFWIFLILRKKIRLKTPLTIPIFIFWIIGAISTFHGVLILFPTLSNVFSNVALLSFLRRVEYMSLFFIAFASITNKKYIYHVIWVLALTMVLITLYGLGQRFYGFPAFLTGNEEFAKGAALQVSQLGRIPSTFAGHYDLAAYLVLVIPILVSLAFGFKSIFIKILLLGISLGGFWLLFMTVSRVSLAVILVSLFTLLILHGKKLIILLLLALTGIFLILSPGLIARYQGTVTEVNVLFDTRGEVALGQVRSVPNTYFANKTILIENVSTREAELAIETATISYKDLPPTVEILMQPNVSTGENLPQGTGYVNLPMSPTVKRAGLYLTEKTVEQGGSASEVRLYEGLFAVKKARAYDLSFTTRFQGEWPRTIDAFLRNIFIGSGYGSVSLAVDNDYLRILGESGLFGFLSFVLLFLIASVYIKKTWSKVDSPVVRSFVLGFAVGTLGLILNGVLIDVFEASKIAFTYWLLMGVTLGILHLYNSKADVNMVEELKKVLTSSYAVVIYLLTGVIMLLIPMYSNYFVGDDFTWLRWAAESDGNVLKFFTDSDGFFYRPGAKLYFFLMYKFFWLNQIFYHLVSIVLHSLVVLLLFLILRKIFKNYILSIIGIVIFLTFSSYHEAIFWISGTGFLFTSCFALASLLLFIFWKERKNNIYLFLSVISSVFSFFFHELGIITPLLIISYELVFGEGLLKERILRRINFLFLLPILPYLFLRFIANSHWQGGDYSYNLVKLPFNFAGNAIGYFTLDVLGPQSLGVYELLRNSLRENTIFAILGLAIFAIVLFAIGRLIMSKLEKNEKKIIVFGLLFFVIALLPFLGLGNISSRYSYLSSAGLVIIFPIFIRKAYTYLQSLGDRSITFMIVFLITIFFISIQFFQLQKVHSDWKVAGDMTKNFLVSFQSQYKDIWVGQEVDIYFVDVPIRHGQAWVFPVGLADSVWFSFRDPKLHIHESESIESALLNAKDPFTTSAFQFDDTGRVKEIERK